MTTTTAPPPRRAAPIVSTTPEIDDRPCFVCDTPLERKGTGRTMTLEAFAAMAIHPVTGEWRWVHPVCGLNQHVTGKRRRRWTMCATCGLPLKGDHTLASGGAITYAMLVEAAPNDATRAAIEHGAAYAFGVYVQCRDGGLYVRGRDVFSEVPAGKATPHMDDDFLDDEATYDDTEAHPSDVETDEHAPPF